MSSLIRLALISGLRLQVARTTSTRFLSVSAPRMGEEPTAEPATFINTIPTVEQLEQLRKLNDDPHDMYAYYDIDALCVDKRVPQPDAGFKDLQEGLVLPSEFF